MPDTVRTPGLEPFDPAPSFERPPTRFHRVPWWSRSIPQHLAVKRRTVK